MSCKMGTLSQQRVSVNSRIGGPACSAQLGRLAVGSQVSPGHTEDDRGQRTARLKGTALHPEGTDCYGLLLTAADCY